MATLRVVARSFLPFPSSVLFSRLPTPTVSTIVQRSYSTPSQPSTEPSSVDFTQTQDLPHFPPFQEPAPPTKKRPPPPPPDLPVFRNPGITDIYSISAGEKTEFVVDDKPVVAEVFGETDFGNFEPVRAPPPEIPKRKRKTKAEREKEKSEAKPENQPHVPTHLQNPQEAFRYRILMARIEGEEEMKRIEQEMEDNLQKGDNQKTKEAIESGLNQTQWKLRPLGFHSKWLWGLARKFCGDDYAVKYLIQSRKNLPNWYLFAPTRQIVLWRDCVDDLITSAGPSLDAKKITVAELLDCIAVYHVDTDERNQYTYLEDQITGYKAPHPSEKVRLLLDNLEDKYVCEMFIKMVEDFQAMMKLMTEQHMLDLLKEGVKRISEQEFKKLAEVMDGDKAMEIRHMPEVRKMFGHHPVPRPIPPPFVPPPEPPKPKVPSEF